MKKVNVGVLFDQVKAQCNFCGEKDKECFESSDKGGVSSGYQNDKYDNEGNYIPEWVSYNKKVYICKDCIKQLNNL